MISVHLDTDIGDDIDDAFCLALLLQCPELSIQSITTVLNDTAHRADMCRDLCSATGKNPPIAAGSRGVLTRRPVEWAMKRNPYHSALRRTEAKSNMPETLELLAAVRRSADVLLTIGPMTNLAMSLVADPDVSRFPRYIAMAGEVRTPHHGEWNIRVDVDAAAVVLDSPISIDFIPWRIGIDTKLTDAEQAELDRATNPVAKVLNAFRQQFKKTDKRQEMFDPMTIVALLHDDWFTWQRGTVAVETRGDHTYGLTHIRPHEDGRHRVAVGVDAQKAKRWMLDRLCAEKTS